MFYVSILYFYQSYEDAVKNVSDLSEYRTYQYLLKPRPNLLPFVFS